MCVGACLDDCEGFAVLGFGEGLEVIGFREGFENTGVSVGIAVSWFPCMITIDCVGLLVCGFFELKVVGFLDGIKLGGDEVYVSTDLHPIPICVASFF